MYFENHNGIVPSFSAFADTIPEPIYWLDLNHRMLGVNEFAIKAAGARSEKGENWSIFFNKIDNFIDNFIQSNKLQDKKIICLIDKSKLADNAHDTELYKILDHLKTRLKIKSMEIAYIENPATLY